MGEDPTASTVDGNALRAVFAGVPSAISVITIGSEHDRYGATIGSLISLSLAPPLLAFGVKCGSGLLSRLSIGARFGVNVLAADQELTARGFAASGRDRFEGTRWCHDSGTPRIDGSAAWLVSEVAARHIAGDHEIVVGLVRLAERAQRSALLFAEQDFYSFMPKPAGCWPVTANREQAL